MEQHKFELLVDGVPYFVNISPFNYNNQVRYKVSYNGGKEDIFVWDTSIKRLFPIDEAASILPDGLSVAISNKIASGNY